MKGPLDLTLPDSPLFFFSTIGYLLSPLLRLTEAAPRVAHNTHGHIFESERMVVALYAAHLSYPFALLHTLIRVCSGALLCKTDTR